jgi:hypothetical protein
MIRARLDPRLRGRGRERLRLAYSGLEQAERVEEWLFAGIAVLVAPRAAARLAARQVAGPVARGVEQVVARVVAVPAPALRLAPREPPAVTPAESACQQESERKRGRNICGAQPRGYQNQPIGRELHPKILDATCLNGNSWIGRFF